MQAELIGWSRRKAIVKYAHAPNAANRGPKTDARRFSGLTCSCQYVAEIQIHQRRIEKKAVQKIENSTNAGKQMPGIFKTGLAFEENSIQSNPPITPAVLIWDDSQNDRMRQRHSGQAGAGQLSEDHARAQWNDNDCAARILPTFMPGLMRGIILCLPMSEPTAYAPQSRLSFSDKDRE